LPVNAMDIIDQVRRSTSSRMKIDHEARTTPRRISKA
jgi:hypothetical protein